ncbi:proline--tRNA ligase [Oceanivirga miroungae]|uniref:Proline--tRNA ligase n=1 Tax=Oceanivirga miroungae TaxID=1130046 RepID=A0A6I8M7U0_9FUSO|nr:proline--tRNA ligase [Oceanivirga miroungae]VWL85560.1 prolyl-tRNA synthetase [Oceanivirga miroungae]
MRFSKLMVKTYKESPKEAEAINHKLMLRASMIKQISRGNYTYLPLGLKVIKKIENIIREEMNNAGANEILMPIMQPSDLWIESGRFNDYGPELMRFKDRNSRDFVLGPTHEEVSVSVFRDMITSYKDLPLNMYQIQTKFRDEMRPRFGLMRGREFIMKDAYSYHLTKESLDEEYENMKNTYIRIFNRCGLNFRPVEADTGSIGGAESHEFMVLASAGEDDILYSNVSDYAANVEKAKSIIDLEQAIEDKKTIELVNTPDIKTIDELSKFLNIDKKKLVKSVLLKANIKNETKYFMAVVRGDLDVNEIKVKNAFKLSVELEMVESHELEGLGIEKGFMGPVKDLNKDVKVVIDESVKYLYNFVIGANKKDYHYINTNLEDIRYDEVADIRVAKEGDISPDNKGTLEIARGIEVGHIFKLGYKYSEAMNAKVLDENGRLQTVIMGCYGIGVSRIAAAAIEQNNDENGMIWPKNIAPFTVDVIATNINDDKIYKASEKIYEELLKENVDVIFDDRKEKAGFKFKDADLIGIPIKVIVGKNIKDGLVELKSRKSNEVLEVKVENVFDEVSKMLESY